QHAAYLQHHGHNVAVNWIRNECGPGDGKSHRTDCEHDLLLSYGSTKQRWDAAGINSGFHTFCCSARLGSTGKWNDEYHPGSFVYRCEHRDGGRRWFYDPAHDERWDNVGTAIQRLDEPVWSLLC
ncbi:MAG: hypothetical protein Q8O03_06440, partial [Nanoarchaeota archaeon]|nr:hypothetical protein [Nanoarchaeota archaeon]